jgi:hypothetical protein
VQGQHEMQKSFMHDPSIPCISRIAVRVGPSNIAAHKAHCVCLCLCFFCITTSRIIGRAKKLTQTVVHGSCLDVHTYMHAYKHTHIHTYIKERRAQMALKKANQISRYIRKCVRACSNAQIRGQLLILFTCMRTCIHTKHLHTCTHTCSAKKSDIGN